MATELTEWCDFETVYKGRVQWVYVDKYKPYDEDQN